MANTGVFGQGIFPLLEAPRELALYQQSLRSRHFGVPRVQTERDPEPRSRRYQPLPNQIDVELIKFIHNPREILRFTNPFDPSLNIDSSSVLNFKVEHLARRWLSEQMPLSELRGVKASFLEENKIKDEIQEPDAISLHNGKPDIVFDFKNSVSERSKQEGNRQLLKAATRLSLHFPEIRPCLIVIQNGLENRYIAHDFTLNVRALDETFRKTKYPIPHVHMNLGDLNIYGRTLGLPLDTDKHYPKS